MTDIACRVRDVVAAEFGLPCSALNFADDLTANHGMDDLDLLKLAMRLEEIFGVELNDESLQQERTIARCAELIRENLIPA